MTKFFLYARKSTDEPDRQILSIETQITELKEFTAKEQLNIVQTFSVKSVSSREWQIAFVAARVSVSGPQKTVSGTVFLTGLGNLPHFSAEPGMGEAENLTFPYWLGGMDSNHRVGFQRPESYH